jgi:hypothetical protein
LKRHVSKVGGGGGVSVSRRRRRPKRRRRTRRRREEQIPLHMNNTSSRARSNEQVTHMATVVVVSSPLVRKCESRSLESTQPVSFISHLHPRNHCISSLPPLSTHDFSTTYPNQHHPLTHHLIPTSNTPSPNTYPQYPNMPTPQPQPRPFSPRARGSAAQRTCAAQKPHAAHADRQTDRRADKTNKYAGPSDAREETAAIPR